MRHTGLDAIRTIPSRLGPLALEERLGHSEHCHTYRAVHIERRVSLAVRMLPHGALAGLAAAQAFLDDIGELKPMVHENVVRCLGGAVDGGWPYVVFEYVRGESLGVPPYVSITIYGPSPGRFRPRKFASGRIQQRM